MSTVISILHTTARLPDGWKQAWEAWSATCLVPERCEYILSVDAADWGKVTMPVGDGLPVTYVRNENRQCFVDGINTAALFSKGQLLVQAEDDVYPCSGWDYELLRLIPSLAQPCTVKVDFGVFQHLMGAAIMTRPYYERYGYIYYNGYKSMGADDDLTAKAYKDGVMIEAPNIHFDHRCPAAGKADMDDVYRHEQSQEAYEIRDRLLPLRKAAGFPK